jgi:hypothetical protein
MTTVKQRIALLRAHESHCAHCHDLIVSLADLEIDHIIPESYGKKPAELAALLARIQRPDLQLNSYRNWVPVHGEKCNRKKSDKLLPDHVLEMQLQFALLKEPRVLEEEQSFDRQLRSRDALSHLTRLIELGEVSKAEVMRFIEKAEITPQKRSEPTVLAFSVNVAKALAAQHAGTLPPEGPALYSYLEDSLEEALTKLDALVIRSEAPERNGETVSMRFAVWLLDLDRLPSTFPTQWEMLGIAPFSEVYTGQDPEDLLARAVVTKRDELVLGEPSDAPLPYSRCPNCGRSDFHQTSQSSLRGTTYYAWCDCGWGEKG